jgi:hypothetical protein
VLGHKDQAVAAHPHLQPRILNAVARVTRLD